MRFLIALCLSVLLHLSILLCLAKLDNPYPAAKKNQSHTLNIFIKKTILITQPLLKTTKQYVLQPVISIEKKVTKVITDASPHQVETVIQLKNNTVSKHDENEQRFYSTLDLERKALPISNINSEMLGDVTITGIPIKLRLYIDSLGKVSKVEELVVLEQDRPFANRLTELLLNTTFLAAKKNGLDVNSYQDIEFSFNPFFVLPTQLDERKTIATPKPPLEMEPDPTKNPLNR